MKSYCCLRLLVIAALCCCWCMTAALAAPARDTSLSATLKHQGNAMATQSRYPEALSYYTRALKQAGKEGDNKVMGECLNNIGMVYAEFRDFESAVFYFTKANRMAERNGDTRLRAFTAINLANAYCMKNEPQKASVYLRQLKGIDFKPKSQKDYFVDFCSGLIASRHKQPAAAIGYFNQARDVALKTRQPASPALWYEMGNAYSAMGRTDSALACFRTSVAIANRDNNVEESAQAYKALADVFKRYHMTDSVIAYQSEYIGLQDSLFNQAKFNQAKARLIDYENELVDEHISSLKGWIWLLVAGIVVVLAVLLVIVNLYRQLQLAQRLLVRKNEALIAHNRHERPAPAHDAPASDVQPAAGTELPLSKEQAQELLARINAAMENPDVIVDPAFNLNKLAKMVDSNTKYVSAILNESSGKSFKTLLNENRIQEVCRRLSDDDGYGCYTIAAIANSAGYNSMNNFITVFKRLVGMTPSRYRQLSLKERHAQQPSN